MRAVLVDSNLLLLLVVGSASRRYIQVHKRLSGYGAEDFELLVGLIGTFSDLVTVPHVITEVSNLSRHIPDPAARSVIVDKLRELIEQTPELPIGSVEGLQHPAWSRLGVTDTILLHLCEQGITLVTADSDLAIEAEMVGGDVLNFRSM